MEITLGAKLIARISRKAGVIMRRGAITLWLCGLHKLRGRAGERSRSATRVRRAAAEGLSSICCRLGGINLGPTAASASHGPGNIAGLIALERDEYKASIIYPRTRHFIFIHSACAFVRLSLRRCADRRINNRRRRRPPRCGRGGARF